MDTATVSSDSASAADPERTLVGNRRAGEQGATASSPHRTVNGRETVNCRRSGSADVTSGFGSNGGTAMSQAPIGAAFVPATSSGGIQAPHVHRHSSVPPHLQAGNATGATVTLTRPPMQPGSGVTLNGSNNANPTGVVGGGYPAGIAERTPFGSGFASAGSQVHPELPGTIIQPVPQIARRPSPPRMPGVGPGRARPMQHQMLYPRPPQTPMGQPSMQNFQVPPGMVIVRNDVGQLLMMSQQTLAQMQAHRLTLPHYTVPPGYPTGQAFGNAMINPHVTPSYFTRQRSPGPVWRSPTTALHRAPAFQSSFGASVPGMMPRTISPTAGTTVTSATETLENVRKCKSFLSTLIKLATSGKQSMVTAENVKQLVRELLEGKLEAEEFTTKLYTELKSAPQPFLLPFLKRSIAALRQLTPDSSAFIQQSQLPQLASAPVPTTPTHSTVVLGSPAPRLPVPVNRPHLQPVVTPQQQRAMLRPQVTLPVTHMVALRNQAPGCIVMGQQQCQQRALIRPGVQTVSQQVSAVASTSAPNKNLKEAGLKDNEDILDVASMAGVNLTEETHIVETDSTVVGVVTHSCNDEAFLSCLILHRRMLEIGRRFGVTEMGPEVVDYVSHATQQRLQNLLEKVSHVAQQKNASLKEEDTYQQSSDIRSQLKFFEQLDQLEKQRKEEQEREILLKAAKSRARQEDPEQLRLKQKAKEMQQQELAQIRQREANLTALAAIGPRKKRFLGSKSSPTSAEGSGSGPSLSGGAASSGSRPTRQRITRVNLRDLLFCLENERFTSHSHLLYKGFLK
ncbi:transcription initiation factor TFIID subunit 4-like [Antennarius striatus]|uniref:transcription initiation factor TFIID subunit 4-like n=1 Tax=Antennarius striatus TaxID=241820 RepID=UPI0035B31C61